MTSSRFALALLLLVGSAGCGPRYIKGTEIEYTDARQSLADLVERYRLAVEQRDADALRALASHAYFENGSTTNDPSDDYAYDGLIKVLADLKSEVKAVRYNIDIRAIEIFGETAAVDYDYETQFLYTVGEQDRWENRTDKNRLTFRMEKGGWRIVGGM